MTEESGTNPTQHLRQQVDDFLSTAAPGLEEVVNSKSFGTMLAQTAGNLVAMQRIGNEVMDLTLRNARIAGRADVTSLQRQLARSEDKLEAVLDTVERLEDDLADERRRTAESEASSAAEAPSSKSTGGTGRTSSKSARRTADEGE